MLDEINTIRYLISEGRVEEALDRLIKFTTVTSDHRDELLLLRNQYEDNKRSFNLTIISAEEFSSKKNKLNRILLGLLKKIEDDYLTGNWLFDKHKRIFELALLTDLRFSEKHNEKYSLYVYCISLSGKIDERYHYVVNWEAFFWPDAIGSDDYNRSEDIYAIKKRLVKFFDFAQFPIFNVCYNKDKKLSHNLTDIEEQAIFETIKRKTTVDVIRSILSEKYLVSIARQESFCIEFKSTLIDIDFPEEILKKT